MELLETNQRYRLFTKNDRVIGTVIYHKDDETEDIVFRPFFHKEGDPWIGALNRGIEEDDWKTSRELFGRYLDDPDFRLSYPTISYIIRPDIKVPEWMGTAILVMAEFDNDGVMTCRYAANGIGAFMNATYDYEGEITLEETSKFASEKIKEDIPRVEHHINKLPPPHFFKSFTDDEGFEE